MVKKLRKGGPSDSHVVEDDRFSAMHSSKLFKKIGKDNKKVKIDSRFQGVLTEDKFRVEPGQVDKYGHKKKKSGRAKLVEKELSNFYQIEKDEENEESAEVDERMEEEEEAEGSDDDDEDDVDANNKTTAAKESAESRLEFLNRFARGDYEGTSSEDEESDVTSDSDSDASDDDIEEDDRFGPHGPLSLAVGEERVAVAEEASSRLAIQNCDWDNVKALDLLMIMQSFCPAGVAVKAVTIYLSDFGKARIEEETRRGPHWLWDKEQLKGNPAKGQGRKHKEEDEEENEDEFVRPEGHVGVVYDPRPLTDTDNDNGGSNGSGASQEQLNEEQNVLLRRYELQRLRYYFAVAELSSASGAEAVYEQLDGVEVESSSMTFDLRFVPDDIR